MFDQKRYSVLVFRLFVVLGLTIPILTKLISQIIYDDKNILGVIVDTILIKSGTVSLVAFSCMHFFPLALFAKYRLVNLAPQNKYPHIAEILGASIPFVIFSIWAHFGMYISIYRRLPGASTSAIPLMFGIVIILIGGVCGSVVGWLISAVGWLISAIKKNK